MICYCYYVQKIHKYSLFYLPSISEYTLDILCEICYTIFTVNETII